MVVAGAGHGCATSWSRVPGGHELRWMVYSHPVMKQEVIIAKIQAAIPDAVVEMRDLTGTEDHWEATVVSGAFQGKSPIQRHRMVFDALAEEMKGPIHALALKTWTPEQARNRSD